MRNCRAFKVVLGLGVFGIACSTSTTPKSNSALGGVEVAGADTGFKPQVHGFSFSNFTTEYPDAKLDADLMVRMFGNSNVCADGASPCTLTPIADGWKEMVNESMTGGRCEGFAVLSQLMYLKGVKTSDFGGDSAIKLKLTNNRLLQREIAYWYATQFLPDVTKATLKKLTTKEAVSFFAEALKPDAPELYRLGIVRVDSGFVTGGHAVTPTSIEQGANPGEYKLHVYDNNWPNEDRKVTLDVNTGRWEYVAAVNPSKEGSLYFGDDKNRNLLMVSASKPRLGTQTCAFCSSTGAETSFGQAFGSGPVTYTVENDDAPDKVTGYVDDQIKENMADSVYSPVLAPNDSYKLATAEQTLYVNKKTGTRVFTIRGASARKGQVPLGKVSIFHPGSLVTLSNLEIPDNKKVRLAVDASGRRVKLTTEAGLPGTLSTLVDMGNGRYQRVTVTIPKGTGITEAELRVDPLTGKISVNTKANPPPPATPPLNVDISRINGTTLEAFGGTLNVGQGSQEAQFDVGAWQGKGKPMDVTTLVNGSPSGGPVAMADEGPAMNGIVNCGPTTLCDTGKRDICCFSTTPSLRTFCGKRAECQNAPAGGAPDILNECDEPSDCGGFGAVCCQSTKYAVCKPKCDPATEFSRCSESLNNCPSGFTCKACPMAITNILLPMCVPNGQCPTP